MRILYLVGGEEMIAGGATFRDVAFVRGLVEAGHRVDALSIYGPPRMEGDDRYSEVFRPVGAGTISRLFPRLSRMPSAMTSLLTKPRPVVNMTALAVTGKVDRRGPQAVNLLSGTDRRQRREFARLMDYLERHPGRVDVAIFANTMLSGLSEAVRGNIGCPIICLSQGSDRFIEALEEPYRSDARKLVRKNAKLFRRVVATSRFFAIRATESMALPASRMRVIPPGIDAERIRNPVVRRREPFTVGYMAPIRKDKGLDILVEAIDSLLKETPLAPQLWIAGQVEDERYWQRIRRRLDAPQLRDKHRYFDSMAIDSRREFMAGLSAFVVPAREPESRATYLLEAMAAGVPVVGPATGIIPEIFQYANGGLLVASEAPAWMLSQALELLAAMPDTADELGMEGAAGVTEHFSLQRAATRLLAVIAEALTGDGGSTEESGRLEREPGDARTMDDTVIV